MLSSAHTRTHAQGIYSWRRCRHPEVAAVHAGGFQVHARSRRSYSLPALSWKKIELSRKDFSMISNNIAYFLLREKSFIHLSHGTLFHLVSHSSQNLRSASNYLFTLTPYLLVHEVWWFFWNISTHRVPIPYSLSQGFIISYFY